MKKLLAIVISMAMIVAMMPMGVFATGGTEENTSLIDAINKLSKENHTLVLPEGTTWPEATPVYWKAGEQSGFEANLTTALTNSYKANKGDITIVCKPDADVGTMTHGHVEDNLTIYGNNAYISDGECELEVDTFMYSRETGAQVNAGGKYLENDITIIAYELDNLGVWGQRNTNNTVNVNLIDCDGKAVEGKNNVQRVYISGKTGTNNITLTDCDFITKKCPIYSNADGNIRIENCTFNNVGEPINLKHKGQGTANYNVTNCTFTNCGSTDSENKAYAAPIRFVSDTEQGTVKATVDGCTFTGTVGSNGDILLGDGRPGEPVNSVSLIVSNAKSATTVMAQKSGYYDENGNVTDSTKAKAQTIEENGSLTTSIEDAFCVAKIGEAGYPTLQAAINAENDGIAIKLIKNVTEDITVPAGKTITIDLNGKTIANSTKDTITVAKEATLTVEGTGVVDNKTHAKAAVFNNGTVILNGGTYDRTLENGKTKDESGNNSFYTIINHGTMTINDGVTVQTAKNDTAKGKYSSLVENGYQSYNNQYNAAINSEKPVLTINGGSFFGGLNTIKNDDGAEVTINNGTFRNFYQAVVQNHNIATINDGEFSAAADGIDTYGVDNCGCAATYDVGTLTIKGGTFTASKYAVYDRSSIEAVVKIENGTFSGGVKAIGINESKANIAVTGGTFSSDPSEYIASGYYKIDNADGTYTVSRISSGGGAVVTPTTDNVTNNTTDKNTTADLTPAVSDNKSTTTVDNTTADKIVDKAVENKSTEVIVDAKGNNTVASSEVAIPEKTVKEISEKTDANLVIKTDNGQVDLDRTALAAVAEQAGTAGTVTLVVETVKTDADICHVELKLVTSNGAVKDFKGGNVKVTIDLNKELAAKELVCVYIDDNDIYTLVEGVLNADGTYTFTTGHFSEYAVMAKADAEKKIAEQLNTLIKEVNLKVRTSKTSKKNIKAVVSGDVKALTDAGYTVKYKFYRSTKKASKYTAAKVKDTNTYINTTGKKGTKYYYKAKALVYDGDKLVGQTVLTQCKYGVRTWSK